MPGTLFVVATPIGNLEDVTARALRVLRQASVIAAEDTRRTARLLARYAIETPTTSLHAHNEAQKTAVLLSRLARGDTVALVSDAGTPTISDPGHRLVRQCLDQGIRVEAVPGPSAVMAALSVSGFPADTFTFLGFPPSRSKARTDWFSQLRERTGTVVFFEAPHRIHRTLQQLGQSVGDCEIAICREMTKAHEELVIGPISEALRSVRTGRGEYSIVVRIGHKTDNVHPEPPEEADIAADFGRITESAGMSRRHAIRQIADKYGLKANVVYQMLERGRKLVTRQK
jgi:16S rRNA (cytidine1402-2'-O)-methyltransferase